MKVLLIEDDRKTAEFIVSGLAEAGHSVDHSVSAGEGEYRAREVAYDVVIVDRMLPDGEGVEIVLRLRAANILVPILLLTAKSGIEDRVEGLEAGADDYLVKPFAMAELTARLNSLLRRPPLQSDLTELSAGDLRINVLKREVRIGNSVVEVPPMEYRLLEFLLRRAGQVVTRTMLLEGVWDFNFDPKTSVVETHISRLRSKLEAVAGRRLINTVRGAGYIIDET